MDLTHDITVAKENDSTIMVVPKEPHIGFELDDFFSFEKERNNFQRQNRKSWDGVTHLYSKKTGRLPAGLLHYVKKFAATNKYSILIDPELEQPNHVDRNEFVSFVMNDLKPHADGKPIQPYDYQLFAAYQALKDKRCTLLAATAAGKSLIIYIIARILELSDDKGANKKILITVPTTSLVEQLYNDFIDYADNGVNDWIVPHHVQKVSGAYEKNIRRNIVISTWQSAIKLPNLNEFGAWLNDETHNAQSSSIKEISRKMPECPYRVGLTGTLSGVELHSLEIQGVLGPVKQVVRAKELQDQGRASHTRIYGLMLDYPLYVRRSLMDVKAEARKKKQSPYEVEMQFLMDNPVRNKYLTALCAGLKGNTLLLSGRVDSHIIPLVEMLKRATDRPVFAIHGGVKTDEREDIRTLMEQHDDAIIIASWGTMSTGVSIKKLHNLVIGLPLKAKIKILQSIGRMMRLHDSKDLAKIIDIGDDLSINGKANIAMKHQKDRFLHYYAEGWEVKFTRIQLDPVKRQSVLP
jgi:superfamily II DNA or RNA helicase